jgi:hypothetical protein
MPVLLLKVLRTKEEALTPRNATLALHSNAPGFLPQLSTLPDRLEPVIFKVNSVKGIRRTIVAAIWT